MAPAPREFGLSPLGDRTKKERTRIRAASTNVKSQPRCDHRLHSGAHRGGIPAVRRHTPASFRWLSPSPSSDGPYRVDPAHARPDPDSGFRFDTLLPAFTHQESNAAPPSL